MTWNRGIKKYGLCLAIQSPDDLAVRVVARYSAEQFKDVGKKHYLKNKNKKTLKWWLVLRI